MERMEYFEIFFNDSYFEGTATLGITTLSIMIFSTVTLSIMTLNITPLSAMTFSITINKARHSA